MTPLPAALGGREIVAWRLDQQPYAASWDSGEGAFRFGGRWNSKGIRAVYCSLDPATAILEIAVHKGFRALDTVPHVLTAINFIDSAQFRVIQPDSISSLSWLRPGIPSAEQQAFGDNLLVSYDFIVIPSVVSSHSWNLIFAHARGEARYALRSQEAFTLDARLHPPARSSPAGR